MAVATTGESHGLFWNSKNGDRTYDVTSFEYWMKKFFTSGVFNGDMQVLASSGMTVTVGTGYSNSDGKPKRWPEQTELTLSPANSVRPRIDTIVITRDNIARDIFLEVITGAYSADTPVPTPPVRNDDTYQLVLAQILVEAGVTEITQSKITDTRVDADLCGYVTGTVEELDFEAFTLQFQAYFAEFESTNLAEFNEWFANLHYVLDGDVAGHLQNEIDELKHSSGSNANLAPVEEGTTATSVYAVGEYVVVDGILRKVKSAIAIGDTFTEGTNIEKKTVGEEMMALSQTVTQDVNVKYNEADDWIYIFRAPLNQWVKWQKGFLQQFIYFNEKFGYNADVLGQIKSSYDGIYSWPAASVTINSTYINYYLKCGAAKQSGNGYFVTTNKISVTQYTKLVLKGSMTLGYRGGGKQASGTVTYSVQLVNGSNVVNVGNGGSLKSAGTISQDKMFDISQWSGEYQIRIKLTIQQTSDTETLAEELNITELYLM